MHQKIGHARNNTGSGDARRTQHGHIAPKHDYEALWKHPTVAKRATKPHATSLRRRPGTMKVHELRILVRRDGRLGRTQKESRRTENGTALANAHGGALRNIIMKHCGSTQQSRHTSARLLVAFLRVELLCVRSGVVPSSLVEGAILSSNILRHDFELMHTTFHFPLPPHSPPELDRCKLGVLRSCFLFLLMRVIFNKYCQSEKLKPITKIQRPDFCLPSSDCMRSWCNWNASCVTA